MFDKVKGNWIKDSRYILCSCDERYFKFYFKKFSTTFQTHWDLPIHLHLIDPSEQSLKWLEQEQMSYTWCDTSEYNWQKEIKKFAEVTNRQNDDPVRVKQWLYESYTQCQRFVLLGFNMRSDQSVIVVDVDAYAQKTPTRKDKKSLYEQTAFSTHNGRLMATFCHFHANDLVAVRNVAQYILDRIKISHLEIGLDQKALAYAFDKIPITKLDKEWIRHYDVKDDTDIALHSRCLVYHEKGLRGKDFSKTWTSW